MANTAPALLPAVTRSTLTELAALMVLGSMLQPDSLSRVNYQEALKEQFGVIEQVVGKHTRQSLPARQASKVYGNWQWERNNFVSVERTRWER